MFSLAKKIQRTAAQRRGSVYVAVLGVALIVAVIGVSSVHVARVETRQAVALDEMARARLAAQSGVECVLAKIKNDSNWRQTYGNGNTNLVSNLAGALALAGSSPESFDFTLTDTDGDLDDDDQDAVTVRCVGTAGNARHVIEVLLQPNGEGLTCLSASLHAAGDIVTTSAITTDQVVSSNSNIDATSSSGTITGNAQAVGIVSGNISGTPTSNMSPALEMPDTASVFDYYIANGTPIAYSQLSGGKIDKVVLSSGNNPYGSQVTNSQGIYVIDCQGNKVSILDSRIQATLVFLNATSNIEIEKSILWQPAIANFPALLVQGTVHMKWKQNIALDEASLGVNFNPSHTPYLSASDSDLTDTYPGLISGIVYMTGNLEITDQAKVEGTMVVGGAVQTTSPLTLLYKSTYFTNPPPGFASGTEMELAPGTWKQVAY